MEADLKGGRGVGGCGGPDVPPLGVEQDGDVLGHGSDDFLQRGHTFRLAEKRMGINKSNRQFFSPKRYRNGAVLCLFYTIYHLREYGRYGKWSAPAVNT